MTGFTPSSGAPSPNGRMEFLDTAVATNRRAKRMADSRYGRMGTRVVSRRWIRDSYSGEGPRFPGAELCARQPSTGADMVSSTKFVENKEGLSPESMEKASITCGPPSGRNRTSLC